MTLGLSPPMAAFACPNGHRPDTVYRWRCQTCELPWSCPSPPFDPAAIDTGTWSMRRYAGLLPVAPEISLGEGGTPLIAVEPPEGRLLAKLEFLAPTGSYKDRGTAVMLSHLRGLGVDRVVEDSSGNAGASVAAYAAAGRLSARIYVPAGLSAAKRDQIVGYGAEVVEVDGPRAAATDACRRDPDSRAYASHIWNPLFLAGQVTCAWEIWEQHGRTAPDAVVCPVGQGNLFLGIARGFAALAHAGLISRPPRMYAVQAAACAPVARGWRTGTGRPVPVVERPTAAEGIRTVRPVRGAEIMRVLAATGGGAFAVSEPDIAAARRHLAHVGLLVEPTSAVAVAALPTVRAKLDPGASVVVPLTGSGLKVPSG